MPLTSCLERDDQLNLSAAEVVVLQALCQLSKDDLDRFGSLLHSLLALYLWQAALVDCSLTWEPCLFAHL